MHSRVSLHARQISHPPYSALIKLQVDRTCVFSNLVSYVRRVNAPDALHRLAARLSTAVEPKDDGSPAGVCDRNKILHHLTPISPSLSSEPLLFTFNLAAAGAAVRLRKMVYFFHKAGESTKAHPRSLHAI